MRTLIKMTPEELGARQKIIDAAKILFAEEGLHGTSTRDIAAASGLNLSLISYYFGGKEGLYRTVIQDFVLHIFGEIEKAVEAFEKEEVNRGTIRKTLEMLVETLVCLRTENKHMAKILTREKLSGMPFSREIHEDVMAKAGLKLGSIILRGQKAGLVKAEVNPQFFLMCLVESIMGFFNTMDCNLSSHQGLYSMPAQKDAFKKQLMLIFLEGMFT